LKISEEANFVLADRSTGVCHFWANSFIRSFPILRSSSLNEQEIRQDGPEGLLSVAERERKTALQRSMADELTNLRR
jgi:hypothetical protein